MAFWGIKVKPGKPCHYRLEKEGVRLHITQATLGFGSFAKRSILQCAVEDQNPIFLCSLMADKKWSCRLNLELNSDDDVTFSVVGPQSIHLSGFFTNDGSESRKDD